MAETLMETGQTNKPAASVEAVVPPSADAGSRPVAQVTVDYPPRFQQIVNDVATAQNPQSRVRLADAVVAQNEESATYRPNQQPQWDKVLVNILSRNYGEALKWYNGGGVREIESRDLNNNVYYKEVNELGATGRYKDRDGKLLTNKQIKDLDARGGVFNDEDKKVLLTAPWVNGKYNSQLANQSLTSQLQLATNDAYNAARTAGAANGNIDEQLRLAGGLKPVLDHISSLPPERRQKLLGYISRLQQIQSSAGTQQERRIGTSVGEGATEAKSANIKAGVGGEGGVGAGGGVAPSAANLGAGMGTSTSASTQTGATGGALNAGTTSRGSMDQEQQNLQQAINQELQGVIKSPDQFQQFMRLQSLNSANYAAYSNIPSHVLPPTWNMIPETDVYSGGADRMIANLVSQQRNNALMAAWSRNLYQAAREQARTGVTRDVDTESSNFQNSELFKAINNTFRYKMDSHIKGQLVKPPKGTKLVNQRNEVVTYEE